MGSEAAAGRSGSGRIGAERIGPRERWFWRRPDVSVYDLGLDVLDRNPDMLHFVDFVSRQASRRTFWLAIAVALVGTSTAFAQSSPDSSLLIAHRGGVVDDQRIENSLAAINEAVQRGYHMVEVDIRESRDGHPVVHHDSDFRRFYGDPRRVEDLTWDQIRQISHPETGARPLDFAEYAAACAGKINVMLDTKGPPHDDLFFQQLERILRQHNLLDEALVIGTDGSKRFFHGKAKVAVNRKGLAEAISRQEDVSRRHFLFEHGDMSDETIELAQKHDVTVVPSVNVFHYPKSEHLRRAAVDIRRLRKRGITHFQIDSVYEPFCRATPGDLVEIGRFDAPEAVQGVAVDSEHVYAIANREIGKYEKATGKLVTRWKSSPEIPLKHLNSGVVVDGRLYCAHSNYPISPATSSVEIWDVDTMQHVGSHSFGIYEGSLTWIDWHHGSWWALFAHYSNAPAGADNRRTSLVRFDRQWQRMSGWTFPSSILKRFEPHSCSGGLWDDDGTLLCTGHDRREVYMLRLPRAGSTLQHVKTIQSPFPGQGIGRDPSEGDTIYGIDRANRQVISALTW